MSLITTNELLFEMNAETVKKYKIGQTLRISSTGIDEHKHIQLCLLEGFSTNSLGELVLDLKVLSVFNEYRLNHPGIQVIHPYTKMHSIEVL